MSDMVPEVLNAALDSLFTPKEPGEQEYQGVDGLLYCRNCHTPVQCRVKLWGRDKIVPCLCRCQQEAMAEKKRQNELLERQRKIRQLKATGIQEKHLLEWNFGVAEDNKDIQMAKRYVEQWKKVKAENLGLLLWGDVGTGKSFVAACIAKDVFAAYKASGYNREFYEAHRDTLALRSAAKKAFDAYKKENGSDKKLPRISDLNAEYAMLLERKKSSYAEYRRTKSEMQDWLVAQKIVQEILKEDEQKKEQLHEQEVRQEEENRQSSR